MSEYRSIVNNTSFGTPIPSVPIDFNQAQEQVRKANENISKAKSTIESAKSSAQAKEEALRKKAKEINNLGEKGKDQIEKLKAHQQRLTDQFKEANTDIKGFITGQRGKDALSQLQRLLVPVLSRLAKTSNISESIINRINIDTKKQLQNKGILRTGPSGYFFTPYNINDFNVYRSNFNRRISSAKKAVQAAITLLTSLQNVIKVINIALSSYQILLTLKLKTAKIKLASIASNLSAPTRSKPVAASLLPKIINDISKNQKTRDNIRDCSLILSSARQMLKIFTDSLNKTKTKLGDLKFDIERGPNGGINGAPSTIYDSGFIQDIDNIITSAPVDEEIEYIDGFGNTYLLKLITLPNGYKQYQALDAFSKLKITQTALSLTKTNEQLFEEIKQIIG